LIPLNPGSQKTYIQIPEVWDPRPPYSFSMFILSQFAR
jgi:hypothetical protein